MHLGEQFCQSFALYTCKGQQQHDEDEQAAQEFKPELPSKRQSRDVHGSAFTT